MTAEALRRARTSRQSQMLALNCLFPFMGLFFLGWAVIAQLIPPISPDMTAEEVKAFFMPSRDRFIACMLLCMVSTSFLAPFTAVLIGQIARIEGEGPRVWTYTAITASAGNIVAFTMPMLFFMVSLYRVDRSAELVQLANDFGWIVFIGTLSPFLALPFSAVVAGFIDTSDRPVFPRWYCYLTIASTVAFTPAGALVFFHDGWFAWNSVFAWWLPFTDFFFWILITYWLLRRAVLAQAADAEARLGGGA